MVSEKKPRSRRQIVSSAILDRKIDLVAFRGTEDGRYYPSLRVARNRKAPLQLTDIDCSDRSDIAGLRVRRC